ncbi:hypothetical protein F4781DRAFT_420222 [Annulohypoxylon bovei var. microspora]|nr:hypothetical protein F4781DRAFT_420222 [Annulohypoxylon bovei var. microspora]
MPEISSDKDLPKLLDTPTKQVKWAKKLVAEHLGSAAKHVDKPPMQGMFSRTLFLTLADDREIVLQFRTEPLDLDAFKVAKEALVSVVPDARALEDEELLNERVWAYSLSRLHGKISGEAIDGKIRPHLEAILASPLAEILPYRYHFQSFLDKLEQLKKLPLWVAHYDLNDLNVLIDEDCNVTGLIDWELSSPRPFGVGFGRIHTLAGEYTGGKFWMPDEFEVAERAFWNELFGGMPTDTRDLLKKQIVLVQDAVILGTLLDCFFLEDGKVGFSQVALKALPKFLTYRIPSIRGDEAPYRD